MVANLNQCLLLLETQNLQGRRARNKLKSSLNFQIKSGNFFRNYSSSKRPKRAKYNTTRMLTEESTSSIPIATTKYLSPERKSIKGYKSRKREENNELRNANQSQKITHEDTLNK